MFTAHCDALHTISHTVALELVKILIKHLHPDVLVLFGKMYVSPGQAGLS